MTKKAKAVRGQVDRVRTEVTAGRYGKANPWGGAGVVIAARGPALPDSGFYGNKRHVVTGFAQELSWLFERLRDVFGKSIDFANKEAFYGQLADAADRYLAETPRDLQGARGLLQAVAAEAWLIADEIE